MFSFSSHDALMLLQGLYRQIKLYPWMLKRSLSFFIVTKRCALSIVSQLKLGSLKLLVFTSHRIFGPERLTLNDLIVKAMVIMLSVLMEIAAQTSIMHKQVVWSQERVCIFEWGSSWLQNCCYFCHPLPLKVWNHFLLQADKLRERLQQCQICSDV